MTQSPQWQVVVALLLAGFVLSCALTAFVRRYALARAILDVPNERSSHTRPTPRGGGIAIAVTVLTGIAVLRLLGWITQELALALLIGGTAVAVTGWVDDNRSLSALTRIAVQFAAAGWAVYWLGGMPTLMVGPVILPLGAAGGAIAVFAIVWITNLYNFMDGIDGIAAVEAIVVGTAGGLMLLARGDTGIAAAALLIAAAAGGFLVWNWAPARIFMGDAGSALFGYLFAVLALASERSGSVPLLIWLLLLGVFIFDATATLLRRVVNRERWYSAHRAHAYQRIVQAGWPHARVTTIVVLIDLALVVLALLALTRPPWRIPSLIGGALLLVALYLGVERLRPMKAKDIR
jgi:Fuc2NAc and GlcNAc transferase